MMQILDAGIGRVLDAVRQGPGGDDTLIVFTSDNGGERFSKIWPFVGRKFDLLEGGLRVPQICRWPGHIEPGRVTDQVCITMDLTATCSQRPGRIGRGLPARRRQSVAGVNRRGGEFEHTLYWRMRHRYQRAVRRGGWKYLKVAEREFLFDIEYDPRERGDLSKNGRICSPNCARCGRSGIRTCCHCRQPRWHRRRTCPRCSGRIARRCPQAIRPNGTRPARVRTVFALA